MTKLEMSGYYDVERCCYKSCSCLTGSNTHMMYSMNLYCVDFDIVNRYVVSGGCVFACLW